VIRIVFPSSLHWYYIHAPMMFKTHMKHKSRTLVHVCSFKNTGRVKLQSCFSQNDEKHDTCFWK